MLVAPAVENHGFVSPQVDLFAMERRRPRRLWKRRSFPFKRKGQRGDMPSFGTQPLSGSDDAASQGRQDNDFEAPQAAQSAVLFPLPD